MTEHWNVQEHWSYALYLHRMPALYDHGLNYCPWVRYEQYSLEATHQNGSYFRLEVEGYTWVI